MSRRLFTNLQLATMAGEGPYGLREDHAVGIEDGHVAFVAPVGEVPAGWAEPEDLGGRLVTPALVDCHTHLVFGGDRAREFEMRLEGASYEEIARAGGGIVSTVAATRKLSEDELVAAALPRLDAVIAEGVGTVEVKSGYGLTVEDELKMLGAARRLGEERGVRVKTSYLAAHAVQETAPLRGSYRDVEVLELPPPSQGVTALTALGIVTARAMVDCCGSSMIFRTSRVQLL
jgi:imidazolonepropionase